MVNSCSVIDSSIPAKNLRTNGTGLFAGLTQTDFDMWLLQDSAHLTVQVQYGGEGMLAVQGLTIYQTNAWNRIGLFVLFCFITLFNVCWVYVCYDKAYRVPPEKKSRAFLLGVIVLFSSLPLMVDGMPGAGDLIYHLMRVEGIKDGLLSGQFPIRISPQLDSGLWIRLAYLLWGNAAVSGGFVSADRLQYCYQLPSVSAFGHGGNGVNRIFLFWENVSKP